MKSISLLFFFLSVGLLTAWPKSVTAAGDESPGLLSFPTAEGYGRFAKGGRGGDVYHVTNLNDSGPGSLREGILSMKGPRTIVFETGGTIELKTPLEIEGESCLTIAGQTAPGGGITLKDRTLSLKNSSDIVIRYLRVRLGDENKGPSGPDATTLNDCDRVILDHLSISWGIDGNQDTRRCKNFTLQWSILSEALNRSLHEKGPHAMCASFRAPLGNTSIHHNLFATSRDRHPTLGGSVQEPEWMIDFRNNVVYNWSGAANVCDNPVNLINNYFRPGPETPLDAKPIALKSNLPDKARGYMSGNLFEGREDLTADNYAALDFHRWIRPGTNYRFDGDLEDWKADEPYDLGANTPATQSAEEAYDLVLAQAGSSRFPDSVDIRLIQGIRDRQGRLIDSQKEVGGWPDLEKGVPPVDTDRDGMPDDWELSHGLDTNDPEDRNGDLDRDGYTNLEFSLSDRLRP